MYIFKCIAQIHIRHRWAEINYTTDWPLIFGTYTHRFLWHMMSTNIGELSQMKLLKITSGIYSSTRVTLCSYFIRDFDLYLRSWYFQIPYFWAVRNVIALGTRLFCHQNCFFLFFKLSISVAVIPPLKALSILISAICNFSLKCVPELMFYSIFEIWLGPGRNIPDRAPNKYLSQ